MAKETCVVEDTSILSLSLSLSLCSDWPVYYHVFRSFLTCRSAPLVGAYLLMCLTAPQLMRLFRPLNLRWPLVIHNIICTFLSGYCVIVFAIAFTEDSDLFSTTHNEGTLRHAILVYWMTKWYELLDTVFMVLRHKKNQISFLHVFHHASVPMLADYGYNQACWPAFILIGAMNSFIHVVMYGYYGLTAFYPLRDFPIKKRVTQLQMTQFLILTVQAAWGYLNYNFCIYSIIYPLVLFSLFSNFYYQAFLGKRRAAASQTKDD